MRPLGELRTLIDCSGGTMPGAVVSDHGPGAHSSLLELGTSGVRRSVDVTDRDGWPKPRKLAHHGYGEVGSKIVQRFSEEVGTMRVDLRYFLAIVVGSAPKKLTARALATAIKLPTTTYGVVICSRRSAIAEAVSGSDAVGLCGYAVRASGNDRYERRQRALLRIASKPRATSPK